MVCGKGPSLEDDILRPAGDAIESVGQEIGDYYEDLGDNLADAAEVTIDVLTGGGISQRDAYKEQLKQIELQQRRADLQNVRDIRAQVREARIARAGAKSSAVAAGTAGGSGEAGVLGSIQAQLGGNLGYIQQTRQLQKEELDSSRREMQANFRGQMAKLAGDVIKTVASAGTGGAA